MINIYLYKLILIILLPLIRLYVFFRKIKDKEDKKRYKERFGKTKIIRPDGKLLWFNAVSVGEINSAWSIVKKINKETDYKILITTTTVTSANTVKNKILKADKPENIIHQYFPIDYQGYVKRFLEHWKPNIFVNIESEIWPNILNMTKKYCPIIILNGKMSKKSFRFWYIMRKLKEQTFEGVDLCLAQSRKDLKRFINLGLQRVQFLENIKFFTEKQPIDEKYFKQLREQINGRKIWLANCSHLEEEEIIIETHKILKKAFPDILTINILRHSKDINKILKLIEKNNLLASTASENEIIKNNTDFYLYDKMGNLGTFFELCDIVLMCGSLQKDIGGHTPAECIKQNCCVLTGPYIENNQMLFKELLNNKACIILDNNKPETISKKIVYLFENPNIKNYIINNAFAKAIQSSNHLNEITKVILNNVL